MNVIRIDTIAVKAKEVDSALWAGLRQGWIEGSSGAEFSFALDAGAGLGSPYLVLTIRRGDAIDYQGVIDIRELTTDWVAAAMAQEAGS